jgi:hypothetical protein
LRPGPRASASGFERSRWAASAAPKQAGARRAREPEAGSEADTIDPSIPIAIREANAADHLPRLAM